MTKRQFTEEHIQKLRDAHKTRIYTKHGPRTEEQRARHRAALNDPAVKEKIIAKLGTPCTVDGITIYPSARALERALGRSREGRMNPNFRFLPKDL